jgi:hypothetical protein
MILSQNNNKNKFFQLTNYTKCYSINEIINFLPLIEVL